MDAHTDLVGEGQIPYLPGDPLASLANERAHPHGWRTT
jgi:hypothetical protein